MFWHETLFYKQYLSIFRIIEFYSYFVKKLFSSMVRSESYDTNGMRLHKKGLEIEILTDHSNNISTIF